jgi:hypothetical protein
MKIYHENDEHNNKYMRFFFSKLKQIKTPWERGERKGKMGQVEVEYRRSSGTVLTY